MKHEDRECGTLPVTCWIRSTWRLAIQPQLKLIALVFFLLVLSESQIGSQVGSRRNGTNRSEYATNWQINDCGWSKPGGHAKRILLPRPNAQFVKWSETPMIGASEQISLQLQSYARAMLVEKGFDAIELFPDLAPEDQELNDELAVRIRQMDLDSRPLQGMTLDKRADAVLLIKGNGKEFPKIKLLASDYLELIVAIVNAKGSDYFGTCSVLIHTNVVRHPEVLENAMRAMSKLWFSQRDKQRLTP